MGNYALLSPLFCVCDKTFERSLFHPIAISTMTASSKPTAITDKGKIKN